jgi:hypothetical protein
MTDQYFKELNKNVDDLNLPEWAHGEHECRLYDDVGLLSFYYFHYLPPLPFIENKAIEKVA